MKPGEIRFIEELPGELLCAGNIPLRELDDTSANRIRERTIALLELTALTDDNAANRTFVYDIQQGPYRLRAAHVIGAAFAELEVTYLPT